MVDTPDLVKGTFRLLEVDNRLVLPTKTHIRFLVSSADVIHSWAVPGLGTKTDACPGRLTQASFYIKREGTFYGQCSEICGVNHGFMPVVVQAVSKDAFLDYYSAKTEIDQKLAVTPEEAKELEEFQELLDGMLMNYLIHECGYLFCLYIKIHNHK
jgi:heme/copper-type cytochrome/quinol oxidase subunit 2